MPPARPNILIITTDQQRTDSLSCYGSNFTRTPCLDGLARQGVLMQRAYCANPVCQPARASIFTGRQPSRHGVWNNGINLPESEVLLSHRLARAGYRTHYVGKTHFQVTGGRRDQSMEAQDGWEQRYPDWTGPYYGFQTVELSIGHAKGGLAGHYGAWVKRQAGAERFAAWHEARMLTQPFFACNAYDWDIPLRYHSSVWAADRAVEFLRSEGAARPFLLCVGFQDPHHTHCVPTELQDRVAPAEVPPGDYDEGELLDKPPHFARMRTGGNGEGEDSPAHPGEPATGWDFRKVTDHAARLARAYYYSLVKLVDREVGRILQALEALGLAENTIVLFTSDHGELLGDHGLWTKGPFHYECLIRIPMLWRFPGRLPPGRRVAGLFSQVDIAPTVLSLAGQPPPEGVDGVDAAAMLGGRTDGVREHCIVEYVGAPLATGLKTIVTAGRKLSWYRGSDGGELYDLQRDGREKVNRWDDPAYAADKARLLGRLLDNLDPLEARAVKITAGA